MEKYQVKSIEKAPFELTKDNITLGSIHYPNWYSTTKVDMQIDGQNLKMKTSGFWKNSLELWKDQICLASSKLSWNLGIALEINQTAYMLQVKNISKGLFVLEDADQNEIVHIQVKMDWLHAKASFDISVLQDDTVFSPEIILFLVHNCNYFLALSGNGGNSESVLAATI